MSIQNILSSIFGKRIERLNIDLMKNRAKSSFEKLGVNLCGSYAIY